MENIVSREQEAFHKLIRTLYKTRDFYNEVAKRNKHDEAFNANALTIQVIINHIEHEFPWIKEINYLK